MTDQDTNDAGRLVAAVDLGSNSFHVTVAKLTASGLQIVMRDRERVRLASGLDDADQLDDFFAIRPTDYSKANEGEDFENIW